MTQVRDVLSRLPGRWKLVRYMVLILAMMVIYLPFQRFYIGPKQERIEASRKRMDVVAGEVRSLHTNVGDMKIRASMEQDVLENFRLMEERLDAAKRMLPTRENISGLLEKLTQPGVRAGVSVLSLMPYPPEDIPNLTRQSFKIQVEGRYINIGKYLLALESMDRLILVDNLQITGGDQDNRKVQVQILASTYLLKEE
ncbi:MAG: type 4a pilus biogenesis protein PilO [Deltaproteobacteria bacterium]|nr:type 4a pilus biogenesis protein PilO [Deltaproteobacteria bacterium]